MNLLRRTTFLATLMASAAAMPAFANNESVERALRSRPELSSFYQGLVNTGVLKELDDNTTYSVFAPNNKAMAKISETKYPCFYSNQCVEEVADILRNHFVAEPLQLSGGQDTSAGSINQEQITFGRISPNRGNNSITNVTVNGNRILETEMMGAGQIYVINGVLATPEQRASVSRMHYVMVEPVEPMIPVPTRTVTKKVYYAPDGTPDGISEKTTTTYERR